MFTAHAKFFHVILGIGLAFLIMAGVAQAKQRRCDDICRNSVDRLGTDIDRILSKAGYPEYFLTDRGEITFNDRKGKTQTRPLNWRGIPQDVKTCIIRRNGQVSPCIK